MRTLILFKYQNRRIGVVRPHVYDTLDVYIKPKQEISMVDLQSMYLIDVLLLRYGMGLALATRLCQYIGYPNQLLYANVFATNAIRGIEDLFIRQHRFFDRELQMVRMSCIMHLLKIHVYRGIRHKYGYPTRGQRTRSNYKTARQLHVYIFNKMHTRMQ